MMNDTLALALSNIFNAEKTGKEFCLIKPASRVSKFVLELMKKQGYIKEFKIVHDDKGGIIQVELGGKINRCGAIKPRFAVGYNEFEKFEKRYLPAKNFGIIIVSTSNNGIITHEEAKEKRIGGRLLAYCY